MTLGAIPEARAPREDELEREEKFGSGRVVLVSVDHGPNSQTAFTWALDQFVIHSDTVHLLHVLPKSSVVSSSFSSTKVEGEFSPMYNATQMLFDKLAKEAYAKSNVKIVSMIRNGDAGTEICAEASRSKPVAVIMGSRGMSAMKSLLVGSATDYCVRHSPVPLVIVPHKYEAPSPPTREEDIVEGQQGGKEASPLSNLPGSTRME